MWIQIFARMRCVKPPSELQVPLNFIYVVGLIKFGFQSPAT